MQNFNSIERQQKNLQLEILKAQRELIRLDIVKREGDIELTKQQIINAKNSRMIVRVTTMLTGISILATIFNYLGFYTEK